ncbi:MAG: response regulator transcription factor [Spirochaetes bacterium]|jgi:two-component system alkaline phosphatase synthesis response regulator PhoP|nr:response regulator transcription factor [Spirochaetota bacterium]
MKKKIFAVDDEKDILEILKINLTSEGYEVNTFTSAESALSKLPSEIPDLIILDIMMQGMDGYEFCKKIRSSKEFAALPIIFLSAKTEEFDKILGLELGGDDYMSKPFSMKELKSRVKAVLRRASQTPAPVKITNTLSYKGIEINTDNYSLKIDGEDVELTKTEFGILEIFMKHPGKIFTRDNIIDSIRGHDVYVVDRTIDVHIMNLRKKLGPYKSAIKTLSGVGYGFKK